MTNAAINNDSGFDHVMGKSYGCAESLFQRLQRRKRVDTENPRCQQLARRLSVLQLVPIGVGTTIGAGVYVLVGTVARERSGPALTLSFLIAGIAAALSALCYAELASRCPSAGSAYHYSYICVGEGVAWLIGWALVLEYTVGGAAVARGITPNLALLCGGEDNLPKWLIQRGISGTDITIDPCAAFLVILATLPLCTGIKQSALVQATVTFANVCVLIFVIVTGAVIGFSTGWVGYKQADGYLPFGINGMLGGAATVFFAYIGFDSVAGTAEEVKHPQRDLPIGIGITLLLSGSLYILVSAVIVGIVPYSEMDVDTPMSSAFTRYGMQWAVYVVSIGAVAALLSALLGSLLPQPRILLAMARDGLLPSFFVKISKRALVPINATIVSGFMATVLTFFMGVDQLSGMVSFGTLLAFAVVGISILILRYVPPADSKINPALLCTPSSYSISPSIQSCSQEKGAGLLSTTFQETVIQATHVPSLSSNTSVPDAQVLEEALEHELDSHERLTLLEKGLSIPSKGEGNRQWAAAMSILAVSIGAIIFSIGACADLLPSWSRWILGSIGMLLFGAGSIVLALLKQDKGQHTFGQSGGFICPFVPWLPVMSVLINVYLLANLGIDTWFRVGIWLIIGAVIYFTYGINHSVLSEDITITIPSTIDGSTPSLH